MIQAKQPGMPHELQIGRICIVGCKPTDVLTSLSMLLTQTKTPDYRLITQPVRALLDDSALEVEPLDINQDAALVLNGDSPGLVDWARTRTQRVSWYSSAELDHSRDTQLIPYRGTYLRGPRQLVYAGALGLENYTLPSGIHPTREFVAAVCIAREGGLPTETLRLRLEHLITERNPLGIT